jgi:uncharacterized coiled-coil DUF342 family protein
MVDDSELFNRLTDRNVEQVNFVASALRKPQPGSRPDGGMASQASDLVTQIMRLEGHRDELLRRVEEARQMIDGFEQEAGQLKEQLATERKGREHLQDIIRQVADLIVNGSRGA